MTVRELVNNCLNMWDENELFKKNTNFKVKINGKTTKVWSDEYFAENHSKQIVQSWKIINKNTIEIDV